MNKFSATCLLVCLILISCQTDKKKEPGTTDTLTFITWDNICYDRAASIWLIHNFVDSSAKFQFVEFGKKINKDTPFDVPGAELGRQRNFSCFETIIQKYDISDPLIHKIALIVHDIDVNIWGSKTFSFSDSLDIQFKRLRKETTDNEHLLEGFAADMNELYSLIQKGKLHVE